MDRNKIDNKYKWDLDSIYKDNSAFEKDVESVKSLTLKLKEYKEKVLGSSKNLIEVLKLDTEMSRIIDNLFTYVQLNYALDIGDAHWSSKVSDLMDFYSSISADLSFIQVELSHLTEKQLLKYMEEEPDLKEYEFTLKRVIRAKNHTLSLKEEELLSVLAPTLYTGDNVFEKLDNADSEYGFVLDKSGKELPLTSGTYREYIGSKDRILRKNALYTYHEFYKKHSNTIAECLKSNVKTNCILSKVRKYESPLEEALYSDNISPEFYDKLIIDVHKYTPVLHRMLEVYKKGLNLDEMHIYDINARIGEVPEKKYSIEEMQNLVRSSLEILGEDYLKIVDEAFNSNWIDYYETDRKMSGAFSSGSYESKPYILLNYTGSFDDIETLAHELGHSMHSYYSNKERSAVDAGYPIFLAEIASTTHEVLLNHYLMQNTEDKEMKKYILNNILTNFKSTVFRQLEFAEFEKIIHERTQNGENLSEEDFTNIYLDLQKSYYGPNVVQDEIIKYECLRIPHFYTSFYVYKYATGLCIAYKFAGDIISGKPGSVSNYKKFISSGGRAYPLDILRECGIDLDVDDVMKDAIQIIENYIDELEKLIDEE